MQHARRAWKEERDKVTVSKAHVIRAFLDRACIFHTIVLSRCEQNWCCSLVKERDNSVRDDATLREEVEMIRAENITLKRMLAAKDSLLIQKSSLIDNLRVRTKISC